MQMPPAIVTATMFFDTAPAQQTLIDVFETHIWPLYRFSSIVQNDAFVPTGRPMNREYHFVEKDVQDSVGIDEYVQKNMSLPLSHDHPLWQVTTLRANVGRSAVVIRVHHSISDGLGLLFAFLPTLSCDDGEVLSKIHLPAALLGKLAPPKKASPSPSSSPRPKQKERSGNCVTEFFKSIGMFFRGVLSILTMKEDGEMAFNAKKAERKPFLQFSGRHVFTNMPPVPTSAISAVREAHKCTFNDAIMAALSGAFRRYAIENLQDKGVIDGNDCECKAFMLVGLPRPVDPKDPSVSLKNAILTPVFKLPIGDPSPQGRLRQVVAMCGDLKSKAYLAGIKLTTDLITGLAPTSVMKKIASEAISKCSCNVSNLPLPDVPVRFAGQEMKDVQVVFVNNIPQITMLSYAGALRWNMVSDPQRIPDPLALGRYFLEEFSRLAADPDASVSTK